MSWLQNTYTRRFNARHKQWGRLFGDRYKSVLVEDPDSLPGSAPYLTTLLDYVHLNPVRAGLVSPKEGDSVLDYPFSSVASGYALAPGKRPPWMRADLGLVQFDWKDTAKNRRAFIERIDERAAAEEIEQSGLTEVKGQTLQATLRRGWYWGSETFKEVMLERIEHREKTGGGLPEGPSYQSDEQARDFREHRAEAIIREAVDHFGWKDGTRETFVSFPRGDLRRVSVAWAIWRRTSVSQQWIAERVGLRSRANVSQQVRKFQQRDRREFPLSLRRWMSSQES